MNRSQSRSPGFRSRPDRETAGWETPGRELNPGEAEVKKQPGKSKRAPDEERSRKAPPLLHGAPLAHPSILVTLLVKKAPGNDLADCLFSLCAGKISYSLKLASISINAIGPQ